MQMSGDVPAGEGEDIKSHMLMVSGGAFAYVMVMRGSENEPRSLPDS